MYVLFFDIYVKLNSSLGAHSWCTQLEWKLLLLSDELRGVEAEVHRPTRILLIVLVMGPSNQSEIV